MGADLGKVAVGGDDHGDARSAATEIAAGASVRGSLERVGDADWFRFRTTAALTRVTAYTVSDGDTAGELHVAGSDSPVADDDSGSGANFRIAASVPAGTHYLRVRGFGTPDYTLTLEAGPDDHGDTRSAATEIAVGASARGSLERVGDADWFRFRTTAATTFTASTVSDGDPDVEVELHVGSLVPALADDDSGSGANFRITASVPAGTHYLRVSGRGTADYTLTLQETLDAMEFVRIPAGTFVMGSPEDEEGRRDNETQREVRISQDFWMGKYEVIQAEWEALMGENPSFNKDCAGCPVERVSWEDVQEFLVRLNARASGSGYAYRLPTEAEWEYAARAGTTGARYGELDEIAWHRGNGGGHGKTFPVGQKRANAWGLHDMLGNVNEWTADWYGEYPSGAVTDPQGPLTGEYRVIRGGASSWSAIRVASRRYRYFPSARNWYVGFRLVRTAAGGPSGVAAADDHGDTREAATEVALGASADGRIERFGDEDWFRFRTTAAHTWVTAYTVSEGDTLGELHVAGSNSPLADDDSGSGANFRIDASVPAGTHYLRVRGFGTPDYTLTLEVGPDDHGDTREAATEVAVGASARGSLERVGDEDWFRFRTTAAHTWVTAYTVSEGDTAGYLLVAGRAIPLADDDSGSGTNFRIDASVPAGTHYLRVSGLGTADYTLTLEGMTPNELLDAMEFVRIPAGSFLMGSPEDEEGRFGNELQHEVRISRDFWMGKYEVTQREWEALMGENPSYFKNCGPRCPVERVSWEDVQAFIRRLNLAASGSGHAYRLPTEAEWEYAARAGTTGARHGELDEIAWYSGNSGGLTHEVGQKLANAWGLHDMLGNVREWTADWYGAYPSGTVTDPTGPGAGSDRVHRGGAYYLSARDGRSANRGFRHPGRRSADLGFRLVRTE